jgi:alpha-beta hydrolase superfamily lysophospholipase
MVHETTRSADGTRLSTTLWTPPGEIVGKVGLVHGVGEPLGRYAHVGNALAAAGYAVRGVDFRGHGRSDGKRGHVLNWERYVDDLRAAIALDPGPHAIVAHSMGTMVSLDHMRDASPWGYVGSATTVGVAVDAPKWKLKASRVLSRVYPSLSLSNEIPAEHICSDPAVVAAYAADPLVFSTITPRWFVEMQKAQQRIHAAAAHYTTPAYIPYGSDDRIISIPSLIDFAGRYRADITLARQDNMRHEVFNEPDNAAVLAGVVDWLNANNPGMK